MTIPVTEALSTLTSNEELRATLKYILNFYKNSEGVSPFEYGNNNFL